MAGVPAVGLVVAVEEVGSRLGFVEVFLLIPKVIGNKKDKH